MRIVSAVYSDPDFLSQGKKMNRTQVAERLKLGRAVEAEISSSAPGKRMFIEVRPTVDKEVATFLPSDSGTEAILSRKIANADVIKEYRVRFCVLNPGWEEYPNDWNQYLDQEEWIVCATLEHVETLLSTRFSTSLDALQVPGTIDSPF